MLRLLFRAGLAAGLMTLAPAVAGASCTAPSVAVPTPGGSLPRTSAKLRSGQTLRILAIGSSTTAGVGSGGSGYAQRIGPLIKARARQVPIEVIVSGVSGETASGAAGRLAAEIATHRPDLVVWQLGTNDANFGVSPERLRATVKAGLGTIRAGGADAVLVDPQFSRWAQGGDATGIAARIIAEEGARSGVTVARRFAAMQSLAGSNRPLFDTLISWDGLHLTATGHACMAEQVAGTIVRTALR